MATKMLQSLGYEVTGLTASPDTLALLQKSPGDLDLLIADQTMPVLTGDQLTRETLGLRPELPVVICTGCSATMDQWRAEEIGAKALLSKPLSLDALGATLEEVLG